MFDIGLQEMILIMVLALLVFGPSKLPELGKMLGRAMRELRRASDEFRSTVETNLKMNELEEPVTGSPSDPPRYGMFGVSTTPSGAEPAIAPAADVLTQAVEPATEGESPPAGSASGVDGPGPEMFWAQRGSRLCHHRDCAWVARIPSADRLGFDTAGQARDAGLTACPVCEPWGAGPGI
jgi:Tat protein translocase TatB subunit